MLKQKLLFSMGINNCQLLTEKAKFKVTFNVKTVLFYNNCQLLTEKEEFKVTFNVKTVFLTIIVSYEVKKKNLKLLLT
jgi:hypothetical protein